MIAEIRTQAQAVILDEAAVVDKLKQKIADYDEQRLADAKQGEAWCKILCKRNSTKSRRGAMESAQAAG